MVPKTSRWKSVCYVMCCQTTSVGIKGIVNVCVCVCPSVYACMREIVYVCVHMHEHVCVADVKSLTTILA